MGMASLRPGGSGRHGGGGNPRPHHVNRPFPSPHRKGFTMMHTVRRTVGLACALALVGASLAHAQTTRTTTTETSTTTTEVHRLSTVMGANLVVQDGATVGKVEDIVLSDSGCLDYVVVAYESNFVLVPWTATTVDFGQRVVRVDVTREKFREIPTFTRDRWPDLRDTRYTERVQAVFGTRGGRQTESNFRREDRRDDRRDDRRATRPPAGDRDRDRD